MLSFYLNNYIYKWILLNFAGCFYVRTIPCTNFTVIFDKLFHQQFASTSFKSSGSRVNLIEVNKQYDNLQNITAIIKNINQDDVILLFTKHDEFIENILNDQQQVFSYGISIQNAIESTSRIRSSFCLSLNQTLQKTITILTHSISKQNVAIITDEEDCAKEFYVGLKTSISNNTSNNNVAVNLSHIIFYKDQHNAIKSDLSMDAEVIILLVAKEYVPIVLRETFNLGIFGAELIWLAPLYLGEMSQFPWLPGKLLSFYMINHTLVTRLYRRLNRSVSKAILLCERLKAANSTREESVMQMHRIVQMVEEERLVERIRLSIWYHDNAPENVMLPKNAVGEIDHSQFCIEKNKISLLNSITGETSKDVIRVVTVLTNPFGLENQYMYNSFFDYCEIGLKCEKPIKINGIVTYQTTCCTGFVIELFMKVMEITGIKVSLYIVEDGKYGGIGKDGKWNGVIGDLARGKADMAVTGLSITQGRSSVVNFTLPYMEAKMGILVRPRLTTVKFINFKFMSQFTKDVGLMLLLTVAVAAIFIYFFENGIYVTSLTKNRYDLQEKYYSKCECISYVGGVTLQRDLGGCPTRPGARLLAIIFACGMVILVTKYTAVITAQNVHYFEDNPFTGTSDQRMRQPTPNFRFATMKSSSFDNFFKNSNNSDIKRMNDFMQKYNVDTTDEGVQKVLNGELEAYIGNYQFLSWSVAHIKRCDLRVQEDALMYRGYGFAMNKNFKTVINGVINEAILDCQETGRTLEIYTKWFSDICENVSHSFTPYDIRDFGGLIFILCVTAVVAFPMLLPEHMYHKFCKNKAFKNFKKEDTKDGIE